MTQWHLALRARQTIAGECVGPKLDKRPILARVIRWFRTCILRKKKGGFKPAPRGD